MKLINIALIFLFALLQYKLLFANGNIIEVWQLKRQAQHLVRENDQAWQVNEALEKQILALKDDVNVLEEQARESFGMIAADEIFFQVVS